MSDNARKALEEKLAVINAGDEETALAASLLIGETDPESIEPIRRFVDSCFNRPDDNQILRMALNEALDMQGVEHIQEDTVRICVGEDDIGIPVYEEQETEDVDFEYLNAGDAYSPTIIFDGNDVFVTSYGDYLEALEQGVEDSVMERDWSQEPIHNPHPMPESINALIDEASQGVTPFEQQLDAAPSSPSAPNSPGL